MVRLWVRLSCDLVQQRQKHRALEAVEARDRFSRSTTRSTRLCGVSLLMTLQAVIVRWQLGAGEKGIEHDLRKLADEQQRSDADLCRPQRWA